MLSSDEFHNAVWMTLWGTLTLKAAFVVSLHGTLVRHKHAGGSSCVVHIEEL